MAVSILEVGFRILSKIENGLFYNELINILAEYEYDDRFGFVSCSYTPIHIFFPVIIPVFEYYDLLYEDDVSELNDTLCNIIYFPVFITIMLIFLTGNIFLFPIALFY